MDISIIIPCFNEAAILRQTLGAIGRYMLDFKGSFEIIIVDNGSTDGSLQIGQEYGIKTLLAPSITIAALRNLGVTHSSGTILAFLDADVEITKEWVHAIQAFAANYPSNASIITGAPYLKPSNASWLENHWFVGSEFSQKHINSGNMVVPRALFTRLSGFDEKLITGEDWEFCQRATRFGSKLVIDPKFKTYHYGFPKSLTQFIKREIWHGLGDSGSWQKIIHSRPAMLALVSISCCILCLVLGIWFTAPSLFIAGFLAIIFPSLAMSFKRSQTLGHIPGNTLIASVYILARFGALVKNAVRTTSKKR
ncbi:glycosyltransferase [Desulforhabdus amnigena]|uniref:glycosyltransferase n=1 Tax=Desulforhabdus amnigena TaxID=40218 RepID=UPI00248FFE83|nr:glycosyltransferase [Desulforhabdus amnigena]